MIGVVSSTARTLSTGIETLMTSQHSELQIAREPYPRGLKRLEPSDRPLVPPEARTLSTGIETQSAALELRVPREQREPYPRGLKHVVLPQIIILCLTRANLIHGD